MLQMLNHFEQRQRDIAFERLVREQTRNNHNLVCSVCRPKVFSAGVKSSIASCARWAAPWLLTGAAGYVLGRHTSK